MVVRVKLHELDTEFPIFPAKTGMSKWASTEKPALVSIVYFRNMFLFIK